MTDKTTKRVSVVSERLCYMFDGDLVIAGNPTDYTTYCRKLHCPCGASFKIVMDELEAISEQRPR